MCGACGKSGWSSRESLRDSWDFGIHGLYGGSGGLGYTAENERSGQIGGKEAGHRVFSETGEVSSVGS